MCNIVFPKITSAGIFNENTTLLLIWNKEEFPQEWKESIIVSILKKGDRMDCNNYTGILLLST